MAKKALLIEDDNIYASYFTGIALDFNVNVMQATSIEEATNLLNNDYAFKYIFADLSVNDVTGYNETVLKIAELIGKKTKLYGITALPIAPSNTPYKVLLKGEFETKVFKDDFRF